MSSPFLSFSECGIRRYLRSLGFSAVADKGEELSAVESKILELQMDHRVAYSGPLAGYGPGLIVEGNGSNQVLVTTAPPNTVPAISGKFPTWEKLLDEQFGDQLPWILSWLKWARRPLESTPPQHLPCPVLALAGPPGCGKSLLQNLVTELLGGRMAKPYAYMSGRTDFNSELFGAEHLMIEDEVPFTDLRSRRDFGARLKEMVAGEFQRIHGKGREALALRPIWRITISLNDEPESLMVLPPLNSDTADKILLLKVNPAEFPEANNRKEREDFRQALSAEMPALCGYLKRYRIPKECRDTRFGVRGWQHADLREILDELSPELRLLNLIESSGLLVGGYWSGRAEMLEKELKAKEPSFDFSRLFNYSGACGSHMRKLMRKFPDRVSKSIINSHSEWRISAV